MHTDILDDPIEQPPEFSRYRRWESRRGTFNWWIIRVYLILAVIAAGVMVFGLGVFGILFFLYWAMFYGFGFALWLLIANLGYFAGYFVDHIYLQEGDESNRMLLLKGLSILFIVGPFLIFALMLLGH